MVKKLLSFAMLVLTTLCLHAQMPQLTPIPLNPAVRHGVLPNGMNYYILHNEEPKQRANFYIAQKVGSTLETPEQLGLAHFLEHMAFNGTKHYPGKDLLNYLQGKGIRFGADINAYTSFDETVYNINNVPTNDVALMDSVLLALHDWSCDILLETDEINAERGVIEEEWRTRNDANTRMFTALLPGLYEEYQYQQMPIGKMDIVRNFDPDVLRAYYKKWYRPDQQGIVIVGDFDAEAMEKKVLEIFTPIVMPENAAERVYPHVSDNEKPIYVTYEDPEIQMPTIRVAFKYDKTPFEVRNTVEAYVNDVILHNLIAMMINNRIDEYSQKADCGYAYAMVNFDNYYVSKTKGAFNIVIIAKQNLAKAFDDAMAVVARACKTGFTDSELSRARDTMLASYEKMYNERNKTNNDALGKELIRTFIDNEPTPGIENEYDLVKNVLPMLPVQAMNEVASQLLTPQNQVVVVSQPQREGVSLPTEEAMVGALNNAINANYEAYVDEVITDPLISKMPKKGKIKSTSTDTNMGTTTFELSNGAKVIVKPTDFAADEILFAAIRKGGKQTFDKSESANLDLLGDVFEASKFGKFNSTQMQKYLAGKKVGLSYSMDNYGSGFNGSTSVKDLPTLMEMIYVAFADMNPDPETFAVVKEQARTLFANYDKNPSKIFQDAFINTRYSNNPMTAPINVGVLDAVNYDKAFSLFKNNTKNAAEYTFIFAGNVDIDALRPMLEQYVASLPGGKREEVKVVTPIVQAKGIINNYFDQPMETPATLIIDLLSGSNIANSVENSVKLDIFSDILSNIFIATLREEEGGTYGASVFGAINPWTGEWNLLYNFQTNEGQQAQLIKRAYDETLKLISDGAKEEDFSKVKEAALKQYEINVRSNNYWLNNLIYLNNGWDYVTNHRAAIENLTLADFNNFAKNLYDGQNRIEVVMTGKAAK